MSGSENPTKEIGKFRTLLPQILASTAKNLLLLDLGMAVSFPTIVIPALRGLKPHDNNDILQFTDSQASWFGENEKMLINIPDLIHQLTQFSASIAFILQPLGSIASGIILEPLGRKKSMILVNVPHIAGWLLLYYATSITDLYVAGEVSICCCFE